MKLSKRTLQRAKPYYVHLVFSLFTILFSGKITAQESINDSFQSLQEVIIISPKNDFNREKLRKPLSSIDEFLESANHVSMIKRGGYAWEPTINDMTQERLSITIDGMQIFGACTDKMDPVTSYVEVANLKAAEIESGQQGAIHGSTIGGALNLELEKSNFEPTGWAGAFNASYESNNSLRILGGKLNYSSKNFYIDSDITYQKADDYKAGGNQEVEFSQFEKYNLAINSGYKPAEDKAILATFIYDLAKDVGYPALTMDVSTARAVIGALSYRQYQLLGTFTNWETKLYYNDIKHVMDDTHRPNVPIHMDMPGFSSTAGFYTKANLFKNNHKFLFKIDGYYNKSIAEMTMYPNNPNEPSMFMLTWPDVRTADLGMYVKDKIKFKTSSLEWAVRLAYHSNTVADDFGLNSLKIFYPNMEKTNNRLLKSFSAQYHQQFDAIHLNAGLSYGDRAPSVTEGYGFYLFNSFDNYDYVGNPELKTESSAEANLSISWHQPKFKVTAKAHFFHIFNYILGKVDASLSPMTIGAEGVKLYENLDYARLFNTSLSATYQILSSLKLSGRISYHRGVDNHGGNLPLISPFTFKAGIDYFQNHYSASLAMRGNATHVNFSPSYGEQRTPAYTIFSASFGKRFSLKHHSLFVKVGIENIFDTYYVSYADWNNIPRMGRNIYLNLSYIIN